MVTTHDSPTAEPLRILTDHVYAGPLKDAVGIPHVMICIHTRADDETPPLHEVDAYVGAIFKKAWVPGRNPISLRAIFITGAGTNGIDFSAVPTGCSVCTVHGHEYAVAEHCFMTMTALNRELFALDTGLREGRWGATGPYRRELRGRTLFIIGMGHIGRELVRWGQFFGMRVIAVTRSPSADLQLRLGLDAVGAAENLHSFLAEADFVVVAVPQTQETTGMIGEKELHRMKPTAYLINVGRGVVVDEESLYHALRDRVIAGAAIDVWYQYPTDYSQPCLPSSYPFHELDNVIMTPHNSGSSDATMSFRWQAIAENLRRLAAGEPLENVLWTKASR